MLAATDARADDADIDPVVGAEHAGSALAWQPVMLVRPAKQPQLSQEMHDENS